MLKLDGANAILTGASRGIGVVIAQTLAARGVDLVLAARNAKELEQVRELVARHGRRVISVPVDLAEEQGVHDLYQRAKAELGSIDLLVNNAALDFTGYFEDMPLDDISLIMRVNLIAPMLLTRLALPEMLHQGRGHIINVASIAGFGPTAFGEAYGSSKAGLINFSRSLRLSLKTQRVNVSTSAVCPGFIADAGMFESYRKAFGVKAPATMGTVTPQQVADAVLEALRTDAPELMINGRPLRPFLAVGALFPRAVDWMAMKMRANETFFTIAKHKREREKLAVGGPSSPIVNLEN
jgi:short-subunit dehydrogenase